MPTRLRFVLPAASALLALILLLAIAVGNSSKSASPPSGSASGPSSSVGFDGAAFPSGVHAHDFALSDQRGRSVSLNAYRGQIVALSFLSSNCRACVLVAQQVRGALDELEATPGVPTSSSRATTPGVRTIFVSTAPSSDTPASVRRFLSKTSLGGRVEYLTGTAAQLRAVWHAYRIRPASAGEASAEAATSVLLIDREGNERVGFGLEQITPEGLSHDIRLLQARR